MTTTRRLPTWARRALPWVAVWLTVQALVGGVGRILAYRHDEGDDSTAGIRRVQTLGEVRLRPYNPQLARVRVDLMMAGGQVDLTGVPRVPGGVDLTVHALMAGLEVTVPRDWRVWVGSKGVGGVDVDPRLQQTKDDRFADLRVHAGVALAGVALQAGEPAIGRPL
jgi:hypothetical protein